jgi:hypothetical protein
MKLRFAAMMLAFSLAAFAGDTQKCQKPQPKPQPTPTPVSDPNSNSKSNSNSNYNGNNNSNSSFSSSGSSSTANSGAAANSGSSSTAVGGNSSSTALGGNSSSVGLGGNSSSTALGGSSGVSNAGNSSSTATGGQGGAGYGGSSSSGGGTSNQTQGQSSTATATSNGDGSNNTVTNVAAPRIPVATAYAPAQWPTQPCFKPFGAGIQTMPVGGTFGAGKVDQNCAILETASKAPNLVTFCKVYITGKYQKAAGVTMADCLGAVTPAPVPVPAPVVIMTPAPAPAPAPIAEKLEEPVLPMHWVCTFAGKSCKVEGDPTQVTRICGTMIHSVVNALNADPRTTVIVTGNRNANEDSRLGYVRAQSVRSQLIEAGVDFSRIQIEDGTAGTRSVEMTVR